MLRAMRAPRRMPHAAARYAPHPPPHPPMRRQPFLPASSGSATRLWLGAAMVALVLAQWVALRHAVEHAGGSRSAVHATAATGAHDHWGHEPGSQDCRLLDQLVGSHAPGTETSLALGPAPRQEEPGASPAGIHAGAERRAYDARGPPSA